MHLLMCDVGGGFGGAAVLLPGFAVENSKIGLRGGRASMT